MANLSSREVRARMPEELLFEIIELLRGSFGNATRTMVLEIYERKLRGLLLRMDAEADIQRYSPGCRPIHLCDPRRHDPYHGRVAERNRPLQDGFCRS